MRTTKFRAQDFFTDEWIYGMPIKDADVKGRWHIYFSFGDAAICKPETIGEFTGLQDEAGKDIYEGDVLSYEPYHKSDAKVICVVSFADGAFGCKGEGIAQYLCYANKHVEVIGNIHDNPELLKTNSK